MPVSSGSEAFAPAKRLHYRWEYRRFFDRSEVFRLSACVLFRIPNELGHFRVGITLKSRGSSVERNHVKRQIREAFRKRGPLLGAFDYNVVVPQARKMAHPFPLTLRECLARELEPALTRKRGG